MEFKTAIIGLGSIGGLKPQHIDSPTTENILTHAHAIYTHPETILQAIVETDKEKLLEAKRKWEPRRSFNSLDDFVNDPDNKYDIIIVATPTETHFDVISKILKLQPGLIIAEKPCCNNIFEINEIIHRQKEECIDGRRLIPIMVNYLRRFNTGHIELKKRIDSGEFGDALNCSVRYTRGLKRDGVHAIDLMNWFFGNITYNYISCDQLSKIIDYNKFDPTVYCKFSFEKCPHVAFLPCDGRCYGIFEIDMCFEKARIRIIDNGLYTEFYPISQKNEWGHKSLNYRLTDVLRKENNLNLTMYNMIKNAVEFLKGKEKLLCTIDDAYEVHNIIQDAQ